MATEKKDKKRKAATASSNDPPSKKPKSSSKQAAKSPVDAKPGKRVSIAKNSKLVDGTNGKSSSDAAVTAPVSLKAELARQIKPRKRAADFLSDDEAGVPAPAPVDSTSGEQRSAQTIRKPAKGPKVHTKKKPKEGAANAAAILATSDTIEADQEIPNQVSSLDQRKEEGHSKEKVEKRKDQRTKSRASHTEKAPAANITAENKLEESYDDDDQTAALIRGFESSDDDDDEDVSGVEGFNPGQPVPKIPDSKQIKRKVRKMKKNNVEPEEPGTVYIGRIPHGFYEHEMRAYFSQFGAISRLRLARNRKTGHSKHFAFVEFASTSVAKIVAETMNSYLMFGHILKVQFVPQDQLHPDTFKGANRRFKMIPWNQIERKRLEAGNTREKWAEKIEKEQAKRDAKAAKMKVLGYEMEMPKLKAVNEVPVQARRLVQEKVKGDDNDVVVRQVIEGPETTKGAVAVTGAQEKANHAKNASNGTMKETKGKSKTAEKNVAQAVTEGESTKKADEEKQVGGSLSKTADMKKKKESAKGEHEIKHLQKGLPKVPVKRQDNVTTKQHGHHVTDGVAKVKPNLKSIDKIGDGKDEKGKQKHKKRAGDDVRHKVEKTT